MADKARIQLLVQQGADGSPNAAMAAGELSDLVNRGYGAHVLDVLKTPLKHAKPQQQTRLVGLLDHLVSSTRDGVLLVATAAWMDRLTTIAKHTPAPELRQAVERVVFKWASTYGYPPFQHAAEKLKLRAVPMGQPPPQQQQQPQHMRSSAPIPPNSSANNNGSNGTPNNNSLARRPSFTSSGQGFTASGGGTVSAPPPGQQPQPQHSHQRHVHQDTLGTVDMLIVNIQADLANLELGLQRPELMRPEMVSDVLRNRSQLSAVIMRPGLDDTTRHGLISLQCSVDEVIQLYNALYTPDGKEKSKVNSNNNSATRPTTSSSNVINNNNNNNSAAAAPAAPTEQYVPPEILEELEAERQRLEGKLNDARTKNKKCAAHISDLAAALEAKKADVANAAPQTQFSDYKPSDELRNCMINVAAQCRSLRTCTGEIKAKHANETRTLLSECGTVAQHASRLPDAISSDKQQDLADVVRLQEMYMEEMKLRKQYYNTIQELKGNIRVYCRVRPMSDSEKQKHTVVTSFPRDGELVIIDEEKNKNRTFEFDSVFSPDSKQEEVFEDTRPLIDSVVDGYNVCIFAYGQTGSGKTYTMSGPDEDIGINRRALCRLFEIVDERKETETCTVEVAVLEIYNEEIRDLQRKKAENVSLTFDIKTGGETGHYVTNLSFTTVTSAGEVERLIQRSSLNRSEGRTNMNLHSSRSHMILYVIVRTVNNQTGLKTYGKLSLVDLAGSERLDKSGATGDTKLEAVHINKSLTALGNVICNLSASASHVPFRNSKLTFLLQDSMTGQAKVLMFVCCSPASYNTQESLSSLQFATRARGVSLGQAKRNVS
eukprot:PhM_4_TR9746/c4_g4_i2/m.99896/K10406/KIFC2_3; kinesin family member C2/C3